MSCSIANTVKNKRNIEITKRTEVATWNTFKSNEIVLANLINCKQMHIAPCNFPVFNFAKCKKIKMEMRTRNERKQTHSVSIDTTKLTRSWKGWLYRVYQWIYSLHMPQTPWKVIIFWDCNMTVPSMRLDLLFYQCKISWNAQFNTIFQYPMQRIASKIHFDFCVKQANELDPFHFHKR